MPELVNSCELIMGNVWAAEMMLGVAVPVDIHLVGSKRNYLECSMKTSQEIIARYPNCKAVANTFRFDQGDRIAYFTTLYQGEELITSQEYVATEIADKVGSGDCFMAGLICGYYNGWSAVETLEFATAAAFDKLFIKSDATTSTYSKIKKTMKYAK